MNLIAEPGVVDAIPAQGKYYPESACFNVLKYLQKKSIWVGIQFVV